LLSLEVMDTSCTVCRFERDSPARLGLTLATPCCDRAVLPPTGDLELVRQVLRHESLAMALEYARLTKPDVTAKFRRASPLDNLRAGR
jgi:hypothetical protein